MEAVSVDQALVDVASELIGSTRRATTWSAQCINPIRCCFTKYLKKQSLFYMV